MLLLLLACKPDLPHAIVAADRSGHWLDRPFPSDELLVDGRTDWTVLPDAPTDLGTTFVRGWADEASAAVTGWSHQPVVMFRFEAPIDPVGAVHFQDAATGEEVPVEVDFIEDALGDPYLVQNLLRVIPEPTSPLVSGHTYVVWVDGTAAAPAAGWIPPEGVPEDAATGTRFTVQDTLGQLEQLHDATQAALDADPSLLEMRELKRVVELRIEQGTTEGGEDGTGWTAVYEDGSEQTTWSAPKTEDEDRLVDLGDDFPLEVWELRISTLSFRPLDDAPWMRAGVGLLNDFGRTDGWIEFDDGGVLVAEPTPEDMRVTVMIPKDAEGPLPVATWDHGTGGSAYNALERPWRADDSRVLNQSFADAGVVLVSRDQPLYGQRFPLIDEGFGASLGFYNIGNLPAFRDNQRQGAVDHIVLQRFVEDELDALVEVDTSRTGAVGHSLGSLTMHLGLAARGEEVSALGSGVSAYIVTTILETGLVDAESGLAATMAPMLGLDISGAAPNEVVGALIGLPEEAWPRVDRKHPTMQLFQTIMDPSDPMMVAREQVVQERIVLGLDDWQTPNESTRWMAELHPDATLTDCQPSSDYDGHYCGFREPEGQELWRTWIDELAEN